MPCKNHPEEVVGLVRCSRCGGEFCRSCIVELKGSFYCADCKGEQVRDVQSGVDSTELDLASIGRRFGALMIDGFIVNVPALVIGLLLLFVFFGSTGFPGFDSPGNVAELAIPVMVMQLGVALVFIVYEGVMLQARGQTLGKMAVKIKVVTPEGEDMSAGQAWGRSFARGVLTNMQIAVQALSILGLINYIAALFGKEKKCIHDSIVKTRVINWRP